MLYANYYSHMYVSTDFNISLWAGNELSSRTSIVVNFCWPCCGLWVESAFAAFHVGSPRVLHYIMDRNRNWNRIRIRKMGDGRWAQSQSQSPAQSFAYKLWLLTTHVFFLLKYSLPGVQLELATNL